jgi:hypothetical protein
VEPHEQLRAAAPAEEGTAPPAGHGRPLRVRPWLLLPPQATAAEAAEGEKEEGNGLDEGGYVKNIKASGADLRKLAMQDMKRMLENLGMSEIAIDKLPRYVGGESGTLCVISS